MAQTIGWVAGVGLGLAFAGIPFAGWLSHQQSKRDAVRQGHWRDEIRMASAGGPAPDLDGYVRHQG